MCKAHAACHLHNQCNCPAKGTEQQKLVAVPEAPATHHTYEQDITNYKASSSSCSWNRSQDLTCACVYTHYDQVGTKPTKSKHIRDWEREREREIRRRRRIGGGEGDLDMMHPWRRRCGPQRFGLPGRPIVSLDDWPHNISLPIITI